MAATRQHTSTKTFASGRLLIGSQGAALASAATITITDSSHSVTGSTTITTINGGTAGQILELIKPNGATWALGTGGNINLDASYTPLDDRSVRLYTPNGTTWYVTAAEPPDSIALTGNPTAPTPARGDNDTSIATTAFVQRALSWFNAMDYGATGDGSTDDTTALNDCYTAAAAVNGTMFIPKGSYQFSSTLVWASEVDVIGEGTTSTFLRKVGNIVGVQIGNQSTGGGQESTYSNFTVTSANNSTVNAGDTKNGIEVLQAHRGRIEKITSSLHGGHGWRLLRGNLISCQNLKGNSNTGDGFKLDASDDPPNLNAGVYINIDCLSNGGNGFNIERGDQNYCYGITCQSNTGNGLRINDGSINLVHVYTESNTASDINIVSATLSVRNFITVLNVDTTADISDTGLNTAVFDPAQVVYFSAPTFGRHGQPTNIAGRDMNVVAGPGGSGASGVAGGSLIVRGGDAAGDAGAAAGGSVQVAGGTGINGGAYGHVSLQRYGGGVVTGSNTAPQSGYDETLNKLKVGSQASASAAGALHAAGAVRANTGTATTGFTTAAIGGLFGTQTTVTGGAGATTIKSATGSAASLYVVAGNYTTKYFADLVLVSGANATPSVVASIDTDTPATRTYSVATEILKLSLTGADAYTVSVTGIGSTED